MAILPYMRQLPQDYYQKNYPEPAPTPPPTPSAPVFPILFPPSQPTPVPPTIGGQFGGPWYGSTPPTNPQYGWLWLNSNNNGLYAYGDPGVWTQIGTNW
jgi:hypothetical protein